MVTLHELAGYADVESALDAAAATVGEEKRASTSLVEALAGRIRQAFASAPRGVAHDYLDVTVERALLDERKYARRNVLGGPLADGERVVLAVEAPSEDAVRATLARDPWSETDLVIDVIEPWTIRLDSRLA